MKLNIQNLSPFSKQKDQKRDTDGKFTAGSGGLSKLKKFNWARSAPIIVLISLVGGFLVFRSFAGGKPTPAYQYSAYDKVKCPSFSKDKVEENATWNSCANLSAEALTYRLYHGILGRDPEVGVSAAADAATGQPAKVSGYAYWTQKLAGDRTRSTRVTQLILNSKESSGSVSDVQYVASLYLNVLGREGDKAGKDYWTGQLSTKKKTRQDALAYFAAQANPKKTVAQAMTDMGYPTTEKFVTNLYAGFLGRKPDDKGLASWTSKLNTKKLGRNQVAAVFAQSSESSKYFARNFANFIKGAPQVTIKTTAQDLQVSREAKARLYSADTNNKWKAVVENKKDSDTDVANARKILNKSKLSTADYDAIGKLQHASESKYNAAAKTTNEAIKSYNAADKIFKEAKDVEAYSPDLGTAATETWRNKAAVYTVDAKNKTKDIKTNIATIAGLYKQAVSKYNSQCNSGTDYNGSGAGCGSAPIVTSDVPSTGSRNESCPRGQQRNSRGVCYTPRRDEPHCDGTKHVTTSIVGNKIKSVKTWQTVDGAGCKNNTETTYATFNTNTGGSARRDCQNNGGQWNSSTSSCSYTGRDALAKARRKKACEKKPDHNYESKRFHPNYLGGWLSYRYYDWVWNGSSCVKGNYTKWTMY